MTRLRVAAVPRDDAFRDEGPQGDIGAPSWGDAASERIERYERTRDGGIFALVADGERGSIARAGFAALISSTAVPEIETFRTIE